MKLLGPAGSSLDTRARGGRLVLCAAGGLVPGAVAFEVSASGGVLRAAPSSTALFAGPEAGRAQPLGVPGFSASRFSVWSSQSPPSSEGRGQRERGLLGRVTCPAIDPSSLS